MVFIQHHHLSDELAKVDASTSVLANRVFCGTQNTDALDPEWLHCQLAIHLCTVEVKLFLFGIAVQLFSK